MWAQGIDLSNGMIVPVCPASAQEEGPESSVLQDHISSSVLRFMLKSKELLPSAKLLSEQRKDWQLPAKKVRSCILP